MISSADQNDWERKGEMWAFRSDLGQKIFSIPGMVGYGAQERLGNLVKKWQWISPDRVNLVLTKNVKYDQAYANFILMLEVGPMKKTIWINNENLGRQIQCVHQEEQASELVL